MTRRYPVGTVTSLRGPAGRCVVTAPDELILDIPAPTGHVRLWLAQTGTWTYTWNNDDATRGELEAVPDETPVTEDTAPQIEAA